MKSVWSEKQCSCSSCLLDFKPSCAEANKYFIDYISKAYQALTDPISRDNFEKYGHPDGRQGGIQMGIALPQFLLNFDGASGGILLLGIVGVCIILPLTIAVIYLSRSSKYTGNYVMHYTMYAYYHFMKPSLAPRSELNLDLRNIRQEQAKFWKQYLSGFSEELSPYLQQDFKKMLALAPRLLEELIKKVRSFQDFREMKQQERVELLLTQFAGFSDAEAQDVEIVLEMMPSILIDLTCETEGEEGIQEGDIVTMQAWITIWQWNDSTPVPCHMLPNDVWIAKEIKIAVKEAINRVKSGCDAKSNVKLKVGKDAKGAVADGSVHDDAKGWSSDGGSESDEN
ncbi:hypothetical protein SASPL_105556 [Salvia splendens]|uniref:Translocation protein SEC63 n=1 Tax=Salvia splendens TaxID=180675 RepID=A0A8X9A8S6_SALSN|nr:hypothetical protein SASPL_105556 [Salvia splendens]